mgnify:CR=1 FL=1
MQLITISNLKMFLDGKSDTQHDRMLELIINGVSDIVQTHLNRYLLKAEYTHYFEADNLRKAFYLPAYPVDLINELFTVTIDDDEQTIDDDYYVREEEGLIVFYLPPIYTHPKNIKVVWTGGYETIDDSSDDDGSLAVSDTIKLAVCLQCSYVYRRRNDIGVSTLVLPDGSIKKSSKAYRLLPEVVSMLENHRRVPGAR